MVKREPPPIFNYIILLGAKLVTGTCSDREELGNVIGVYIVQKRNVIGV